jgi:hypothetical protein
MKFSSEFCTPGFVACAALARCCKKLCTARYWKMAQARSFGSNIMAVFFDN